MTGAIRINLKGREPEGLVEPGAEYEALRQEIADALIALENPETGKSAVRWVVALKSCNSRARVCAICPTSSWNGITAHLLPRSVLRGSAV